MNKKIWITNHFKQVRCSKRCEDLDKLKRILLAIKSEKEQVLIYKRREKI